MVPTESKIEAPIQRAFPIQGTNLYRILNEPDYKSTFHARLKRGNRFMATFYKLGLLPVFGMSKQIMLLTTRGRKSNEMRDTPIGYFRIDGGIYVFSAWGKATNWYKNLVACPDEVFVQIGFRRTHAIPQVVSDPQELKCILEHFVQQDPQGARLLMGWDPALDRPETADFSTMIEKVLVVRFKI